MKKEDDVFKVDLKRALEILSMPKLGRGGRVVLKDLGKPKESKDSIQIFNGPYGIYAKLGKVNVSLPKGTDVEKITIEEVMALLEEKLKDKKSLNNKKSSISKRKVSKVKRNKKAR